MSIPAPRSRLRCAAVLTTLLVAASNAPGGEVEEGAAAPAGAWVCESGSPARTAVALTPPIERPVHVAWEYVPAGDLEGEPLVHEDVAIVTEHRGDGVRALVFLDLRTGETVAETTFATAEPLRAAHWRGLVVVRSGARDLTALRRRGADLARAWYVTLPAPAHATLLYGRELYVRAGDTVHAYSLPGRTPTWSTEGGFRGDLALRGSHVYAVHYDEHGQSRVVALDRRSGERVADAPAGHHKGEIPAVDARLGVSVLRGSVIVYHALPIERPGGQGVVAEVERRVEGGVTLGDATAPLLGSTLVPCDAGWIGLVSAPRPELLRLAPDGSRTILADEELNPAWREGVALPSRAGRALLLSGRAIDARRGDVLWQTEHVGDFRAVPARDAVLLAVSARRLLALRGDDSLVRHDVWLARLPKSAGEERLKGTVVRRSGGVLEGSFGVDRRARALRTEQGATIPFDDVLLAYDRREKGIVGGNSAESLVRGERVLRARRHANFIALLAGGAEDAGGRDLATDLLARATLLGADDSELRAVESRLAEPSADGKRDETKLGELRTDLRWSDSRSDVRPSGVLRGLSEEAPDAVRIDLLRMVLESEPGNRDAQEQVARLLPPDLLPAAGRADREWLDMAAVARQTPVRVLSDESVMGGEVGPDVLTLADLRKTWRADLVAVESEHLRVFSPVTRPGSLARCLSLGELVCERLEEVFAVPGEVLVRVARKPLTLLLYESAAEYRTHARARRSAEVSEWTAGHYAPSERLSHMYLPADDDEFRKVLRVFTHELTHQWVEERCWLFTAAETENRSARTPGLWIVEGFASWIEEHRFDLRRRRCEVDDQAESVALVASLGASDLLPWPRVVALDHEGFLGLRREIDREAPQPFVLGRIVGLSETHVFYAQAAAACHYLLRAEDGRLRPPLLEYLRLHYIGRPPDFEAHFGMTPTELGRRVVAWCRARRAPHAR